MTHVLRRFVYLMICLAGTGCIANHSSIDDSHDPGPRGNPEPPACNINTSDCEDGLVCALIDPCGSACPDDHDGPCPQVCVEVYGCVQPLVIEDVCNPEQDHCGNGLVCTLDEGQCGPTNCYDEGCAECPPVYTCQPETAPATCDQLVCDPGFRCELIAHEGCGYADPDEQRACEALPRESAVCVELEDHQIGDSCDETQCLPGFECEESDVYLPCAGPGCNEPADVHVNCRPIIEEHVIGETCEETTCLDGYECWESPNAICHGPGCDLEDPGFTVSCEIADAPIGAGEVPEGAPGAD